MKVWTLQKILNWLNKIEKIRGDAIAMEVAIENRTDRIQLRRFP